MGLKNLRYRILSHITFGKAKEHYKAKWNAVKKQIKDNSSLNSIKTIVEMNQRNILETSRQITEMRMDFFKHQMVELKLFDEEFYVNNYPDYKKYGLSPIDHYINLGWQMRYNPSKTFNTEAYLKQIYRPDECPLIHFLREGRYNARYAYNSNPYKPGEYHPEKNNKKVVYTCISGDYDGLIQHAYVANDYDYICFTDNEKMLNEKQIGHWQIRPLMFTQLDTTRINRYHKLNPHKVLPEYEKSLYIDANINILTPFIFDLIKARGLKLLLPRHFSDQCPYMHAKWILRDKVDYPELVNGFVEIMRKNRFPHNYGMTENNIIYRKHNEPEIIAMMEEWWSYVRDYCKRDQLSFSYVLWKNKIAIDDICFTNARSDIHNFMLIKHDKRRPDVA